MFGKFKKEDAIWLWVSQMNAVPTRMIEDLSLYTNQVREITPGEENDSWRTLSLPAWGTMWTFSSQPDKNWLEGNIETMAEIGFRIYDTPYGYYFGIEGCGYDFYAKHWTPLYEARGLQWHKEGE